MPAIFCVVLLLEWCIFCFCHWLCLCWGYTLYFRGEGHVSFFETEKTCYLYSYLLSSSSKDSVSRCQRVVKRWEQWWRTDQWLLTSFHFFYLLLFLFGNVVCARWGTHSDLSGCRSKFYTFTVFYCFQVFNFSSLSIQ